MTQKAPLSNLRPRFLNAICHLFKRQVSNFYIVFGRRGSGKTAFALLLCEILHARGTIHHFATNTLIYQSPFPFERITNLDDLRKWAEAHQGKKLFMLDEVGKTIKRRSPMAKMNVELINDLQTIRKHKLSLLATTIEPSNTDKAILSPAVLDGVFVKPDFANPKKAYFEDRLEHHHASWRQLPNTSITFDTWDSAPFTRYGEKAKLVFDDEEKDKLWRLIEGESAKEVGLHRMEIARLWRKILKEYFVKEQSQVT